MAKVPVQQGHLPLPRSPGSAHAEGMRPALLVPVYAPSAPLDPQDCLDLLERCEAASLACTVKAMPTVVPVTVAVVHNTLRVALPTAADAARLAGQIVALGAAVPSSPRSDGWWVIVRGELVPLAGASSGRVLALDALEVEGRALAAAPRGRWWR